MNTTFQHVPNMTDPPIIVIGCSLDAFQSLTEWQRNGEAAFISALLIKSEERRTDAGHEGLLVEAAHQVIKASLPALKRAYRECGQTLLLSDPMIAPLAQQLSEDMGQNVALKHEAITMLTAFREIITHDKQFANSIAVVIEYPQHERPECTLTRWLEYVEHLKFMDRYEPVVGLHRLLVSCLRVYYAVFGTPIVR